MVVKSGTSSPSEIDQLVDLLLILPRIFDARLTSHTEPNLCSIHNPSPPFPATTRSGAPSAPPIPPIKDHKQTISQQPAPSGLKFVASQVGLGTVIQPDYVPGTEPAFRRIAKPRVFKMIPFAIMLRHLYLLPIFLLAGPFLSESSAAPAPANIATSPQVTEAKSLIERILPQQGDRFRCELIPADEGRDVFEIEPSSGKIVLRGNSALSLAMALNWYLRYDAKTDYSWQAAGPINLPGPLPNPEKKVRHVCLAKERFFLNYCTFGYTFPFTDAAGWLRFVDWMALNGINRPLLQAGQEAVWYRVWKSYGLDEARIRAYFPGPAHLPWHRMSNLDGLSGPLPMSYIDGQMKLQQQILARARALGMKPILSGFAGHVPESFKTMHKDAKITPLKWAGNTTWFLDPTDSLFSEIQVRFLKEQAALYGTDHLYAADPFNEISPPSWEPAYLASVAKSIYSGLVAGDPDATWYQMSWTFGYDNHWLKKAANGESPFQAMTKAVPTGKMAFLDYVCEEKEIYRLTNSFEGAPFIWNYLANFGGCTYLLAPVEKISAGIAKALPLQNCLGVGSTLEGVGINPIGYDLTLEQPWHPQGIVDYTKWVETYAARRAGRADPAVVRAWQILITKALTNRPVSHFDRGSALTMKPTFDGKKDAPAPKTALVGAVPARSPDLTAAYVEALDSLFQASPQSLDADGCRFDAVNWTRQLLAYHSDNVRLNLMAAYKSGDLDALRAESARMLGIIRDVDTLVATRHEFLLGRWIRDARAWGSSPAEQRYYEQNARQILTTWQKPGDGLTDYAHREWSGLLTSYYLPRWEEFTKRLEKSLTANQPMDAGAYGKWRVEFEGKWVKDSGASFLSAPQGDPVQTAHRLFLKYRPELLSAAPRK